MQKLLVQILLYSPAIISLLLFIITTNLAVAFGSTESTLRHLGLMAGLAGASLFAWNFILASRLRFLEELFFGLNKVYTNHHMVGGIALILLLYHPLLLASQYISYGAPAVAEFLIPSPEKLPMVYGTLALDVMILSLIITFFIKIKYYLWKISHQFLGLSLFLASLHIITMPSVTDQNIFLKIFLYSFFGAAILSFFTRNLFGKFFVKRYEYNVEKIESRKSGIFEVFLKAKNEKINYEPGQFFFIKIYGQGIKKEYHPFSITSPKNADLFSFSYKELGDFTKQLQALTQGDRALVEGPYGKFQPLSFDNKKQIWVAGGIGITPFLSAIRTLTPDHPYDIHFYYSARNLEDAVYLNELKATCEKIPNINIIRFLQDPDGFLTMKVIADRTQDMRQRDIFLCGPPIMMKLLKKQATELNLPSDQIHSEEFALYEGK